MSAPTPLWTAGEAAAAAGAVLSGALPSAPISGVSIDSRELMPGDLFVALAGENRDGHAFVADALARGAAAALVARRPDGLSPDAALLEVDDTLAGLRRLGAAARARLAPEARVVAVTGSVGKTSTKEMLRVMLAAVGATHAAVRSFNNHWGVPLTLARMPRETRFAVLEIGMNHAGEITPLSRLARPHVAMVTTVEAVHLENFPDVAGIAHAKAEIFAGLEEGGTAVLPADNAYLPILAEAARAAGARLSRFGNAADAEIGLERISAGAGVMSVSARLDGEPVVFRLAADGRHFAMNAVGALAAAVAVGADPARVLLALGRWRPPGGRGARFRLLLGPGGLDGEITVIDESYNANPASMRAAFDVLAAQPVTHDIGRIARGRRIAFLADMLELGAEEVAMHAALADLPAIAGIDVFHCCGPRMRAFHAALPRAKRGHWVEHSEALAEKARRSVDAGDVCMVKGSNGMRIGRVVEALRRLGAVAPDRAEEA